MKLNREFFQRDGREVAEDLLGKILVHKVEGKTLKGKIVETEAYMGNIDKASHAYNGRRTARTEPLYGEAGISYVYFIYGKYYCFNIITNKKDVAQGVLIRAVEPLENQDYMAHLRFNKNYDQLTKREIKNLTNGPSKLCLALNITKENNFEDLIDSEDLYVEDNNEKIEIVKAKRIGIDYAEEAKDFLWRYYIKDNEFISKK